MRGKFTGLGESRDSPSGFLLPRPTDPTERHPNRFNSSFPSPREKESSGPSTALGDRHPPTAGCGLWSWAPGSKCCRHRQPQLSEPRFLVCIRS